MDELLALALRTFVDPGDRVLAGYPTYSLYEVLCTLHGCEMLYVDLDASFQLPEHFYTTPARNVPAHPAQCPERRERAARGGRTVVPRFSTA